MVGPTGKLITRLITAVSQIFAGK